LRRRGARNSISRIRAHDRPAARFHRAIPFRPRGEACLASGLRFELALPDDGRLDRFDCGDAEVDAYFRSRRWFDAARGEASPPTYAFVPAGGDEVVGYATLAFRNVAHPDDCSPGRARYLAIYAIGVDRGFQGRFVPGTAGQSFAASMIVAIEGIALARAGCVGLSLWVRSTNIRAIRFYEKAGFAMDPTGPVQRDGGPPHASMRKRLPDR
jgi:ribosomal protein S18 acetylase RimI-like enzyme